MALYVYNNKDWKNKEQDKKIGKVFFAIDVILVVIGVVVAFFVWDKIQVIQNNTSDENIYSVYQDTIKDITNSEVKIDNDEDIEKYNNKTDKDLINKEVSDMENYIDNLVPSMGGDGAEHIKDEVDNITNVDIDNTLDALKATLYLDSAYYSAKINAHDYKTIKNPKYDPSKGETCEGQGFNLTTEAGLKACQDYILEHQEYIHDPSDTFFDEAEGISLKTALEFARNVNETNPLTGRSFEDSNKSVRGWLFSSSFESKFYTPYPVKYNTILDSYIKNKLYNKNFSEINNPVMVKGDGKNKDGYNISAYLIFEKGNVKYKASFYTGYKTYKLLDIEII